MDVSGFDHLNLTVRDLAESAAWYGRIFRFAVVEEGLWEGVRWAILRSAGGRGDAMLCLYERPEYDGADPDLLGRRRMHGIRHFGLRIEDEAAWRELLRREALDTEEMGWPNSTSWYVNDPTGYEIEVACWKGGRVRFSPGTESSN
jgi:catechol 2,3-dioxygenase-like lactoylglutathione lyase family enzyme